MAIEAADLMTHGATGGASALTAGWLVKWLFKNWVKHHDDTLKELVTAVQEIKLTLARTEIMLKRFEDVEKKTTEVDKTVAVLAHRMEESESDLNGLGRKVRGMEQS